MKVNFHGGERDLFEAVVPTGLIMRIQYRLQLQFRGFVPGAVGQMRSIQPESGCTRPPTYRFPFLWEH